MTGAGCYRKRSRPVAGILLLSGTLMLGMSSVAAARINVVGGNSPGNSGNVNCNESPQSNQNGYATIQLAVNASNDGDTVVICPGTYTYSSSILVNKSLALQSSTGNRADVTIQNHTTTVVSITARDTTLRALTIYSNPQHAIHANGADNLWLDEVTSNSEFGNGLRLQNLVGARLTNFRSTAGNYDASIRLVNAGNLTLDGTANAIGSRTQGIVGDAGRPANFKATGLTISPASRNTNTPVRLDNAGQVEVRNSTITAVYGGDGGTAMTLSRGTGHHVFDNLNIKADSYGHGIYLDGGDSATFTDVDIESPGDNPGPALRLLNQRGNVSFRAVNKPRVKLTAWSRARQDYNAHALRLHAASPLTLTLDKVDLRAYHKGIWQEGGAVGANLADVTVTTASEEGVLINNGTGRAQVLRDVTVTSGHHGIMLNGSLNAQMSNLTISSGGGWMARSLHLVNPVNPALTGVNTVTVRSGNGVGIYFTGCSSGARVSGATVDGLGAVDAWGGKNRGIVMENCGSAEVSGNTVKNTQGITISGSSLSASVHGNRVENASIGIDLQASSGVAWNNCLFNTSNARAAGSSEFYSSSVRRGNYWGSWPIGTGYSVTCADGNGDGICDVRFGYQSGKWDEYPLKTLPNCGTAPPTPPPVNPANFNCVESGANASTGRLFTKLAGTAFAFDVVALKADGSVETQFAADANKDVTVELVEGSGTTACVSRTAINPAVSQTLSFAAANQGRKSISLTVAKAHPNLRCRVTDANQTPGIKGCSTDNFAVRPGAVTLTTTAVAVAPAPAAMPTIKAGTAFTVTATTATAATDGYAGTLTLDTTKLTAQTPGQVDTQQNGGAVGTLTPAALPANDTTLSNNASYSEVGYLYLADGAWRDDDFTAVDQPDDCIAGSTAISLSGGKLGCSIGNVSPVSFGRFIPNHFAVSRNTPSFTPGCGTTFTYLGQTFNYATAPVITVTAKNAGGGTTANYQGKFWKIAPTGKTYTTLSGTLDSSGITGTDPAIAYKGDGTYTGPDGTGTLTFGSGTGLLFTRPATPTAPFNAEISLAINVIDVDGVVYQAPDPVTNVHANANPARFGQATAGNGMAFASGKTQRFGVLRLENAYGSELLPLRMPVKALYCHAVNATGCTEWRTNADDTCTSFTATAASLGNYQGELAAGNFAIGTHWNSTQSRTSPIGAGGGVSPGSGVVVFNRPNPVATGSVDLTLTPPAWLQGGSGTPWPQSPVSRLKFGSSRAPYIYLRERY